MFNYDPESMKIKICKECKGTGKSDGGEVCANCKGTGRIVVRTNATEYQISDIENNNVDFDPAIMKVKLCKACKGLGFMLDNQGNKIRCMECEGTGRLIKCDPKTELLMSEIEEFSSNNE